MSGNVFFLLTLLRNTFSRYITVCFYLAHYIFHLTRLFFLDPYSALCSLNIFELMIGICYYGAKFIIINASNNFYDSFFFLLFHLEVCYTCSYCSTISVYSFSIFKNFSPWNFYWHLFMYLILSLAVLSILISPSKTVFTYITVLYV